MWSYDMTKQKQGERSKAGEFNASQQVWNLRCQENREAAPASQEAADKFTDLIKKITEEQGYLCEQAFNTDERVLF